MGNGDEVAYHFNDEWSGTKQPIKHPKAVFFHYLFRVTAIFVYLLCGWVSSSFISCFVSIIILLSIDFWTVKNVTGRLLVGLRWWNYVDDEGNSNWVYESRKGEDANLVDPGESQVFWMALVICPVVWFLLLIISMFRFNIKWLVLVIIALALNGANLYGYLRCKVGGKEKITTIFTNFMGRQVITNAVSSMFKKPPADEPLPSNRNFSETV